MQKGTPLLARSLTCLFAAALLAGSASAGAASRQGAVDRAFGDHGVTLLDFAASAGQPTVQLYPQAALDAQGRSVIAALVGTYDRQHVLGVGLARLLPDGRPDPSFGTAGQRLYTGAGADGFLAALRIDAAGRLLVALDIADPSAERWRLCRFAANGAIDTSFFDQGCVESTPFVSGGLSDLLVMPNGNLWLLGTGALEASQNYRNVVQVAQIDVVTGNVAREVFQGNGNAYGISVRHGVADASGEGATLVGTATPNNNGDVFALHLHHDGLNFGVDWMNVYGFDRGGPSNDYGVCVDREATGDGVLVGVELHDNLEDVWWSAIHLKSDGTLDPTNAPSYFYFGWTRDRPGDVANYGTNSRIENCAVGTDDELNLVGTYTFPENLTPLAANSSVAALMRVERGSLRDTQFGGPYVLPGTGHTPEVANAGTAMHAYRSPTLGQPRADSATAVLLPPTGRAVVVGVSQRVGFYAFDVAVMRLYTDALFGDDFGH